MKEHAKATVFRILQLITRLKTGRFKQPTLAKQLKVSEKTIRRYFEVLTEIGYSIEIDEKDRYYLAEPLAHQVVQHYEPLEIEILRQLLFSLPDSQPLKQVLLHKVVSQSNLIPLAEALSNVALTRLASQINQAILHKKQVILKGYTNSEGLVKDLLIEPLELTNALQIMAYDPERQKLITPSLDRVSEVHITDISQTYTGDAETQDIFGYSDRPAEIVHLELSFLAYNLMLREFIQAKPYLYQDTEGVYHFKGYVHSYIGLGRFCLGLIGNIKVLENEGFRQFLNEKIKNQGF